MLSGKLCAKKEHMRKNLKLNWPKPGTHYFCYSYVHCDIYYLLHFKPLNGVETEGLFAQLSVHTRCCQKCIHTLRTIAPICTLPLHLLPLLSLNLLFPLRSV